jgi:hypothetical protein
MSANFLHPITPSPRTAILEDGSMRTGIWQMGSVRTISCGAGIEWLERLERFQPESIAASPNRLLLLADLKRAGRLTLPSVRHSLVMQFELGEAWIEEEEREELWQAFQVPVFEQLCNRHGHLLAHECEARDGLHIGDGQTWIVDLEGCLWHASGQNVINRSKIVPQWSGLQGRVILDGCACGQPGPRLRIYGSEVPWAMSQDLRLVS